MNMNEFYEDKAIQTKEEDLYGRNRLVENIAKVIEAKTKDEHSSFTIGVYGSWGEGKTSILNLLKEKFNGIENVYQCSFNPWMLSDQESILQEFFVVLQHSLKIDKVPQLIDKVKKYGGLTSYAIKGIGYLLDSTVVPGASVVTSSIAKRLDEVRKLLPEQKPLNEQKKEISVALQECNTHIIVYIDDLDRLDRDEIRMVFRLIRQVADFDNVIYVVAMDVNKVAAAISSFYGDDINDGYQFVEKIVNLPIPLPTIKTKALLDYSQPMLQKMLGDQLSNSQLEHVVPYLTSLFSTKREWLRYLNNLQIMLDLTKEEVNVSDLLLIEAVRVIMPSIDQWLLVNKDILCGELTIAHAFPGVANSKPTESNRETIFNAIEKECVSNKKIQIHRILSILFPEQVKDLNEYYFVEKKICSAIYFDKYFIKQVLDGFIPDREIDDAAERFLNSEIGNDIVLWINKNINDYSLEETMRALDMMIARQSMREKKFLLTKKVIKNIIFTQEAQNYQYHPILGDKAQILSCTKIMHQWIPKYLCHDIPNNPHTVSKDVGAISELLKHILSNASIAYCLNLLTDFEYLYRQTLVHEVTDTLRDGCKDFLKRLLEIGNVEYLKYSSTIHMSFYRFMDKVDRDSLTGFFRQLLNDTSIDMVLYIDRLESEDVLKDVMIEFSDVYKELLEFAKSRINEQPESKGLQKIISNETYMLSRTRNDVGLVRLPSLMITD